MTDLPKSNHELLDKVRRLGVVERDELHPDEVRRMALLVTLGAVQPTLTESGVDGWVATPQN